ncbi:MAG TPA: hypothetical protein VL404_00235 [Candidatus Eisenbacteria bacterium]|nr:hypothetical protein [Candidatus Eisenbacteria bacterium]
MIRKILISGVLSFAAASASMTAYAMPTCGPVFPAPGLSAASAPMACCAKACHCAIKTPAPSRLPAVLASLAADGIPALVTGLSAAFFPPAASGEPRPRRASSGPSPPRESLLDLYSIYRI